MTPANWEVVVIGAGAAGLMAAIHAAERNRRTLLLEKNRKPGVKILMSGGTRCNITHDCDNRGIVEAYGPPGKFLHSALAALSVRQTIEFFESEGVATKVEETGKVFPVSNKAIDVLDALLRRLRRSGATLALEEPVLDTRKPGDLFEVVTSRRLSGHAARDSDDRRPVVPRRRHAWRRLCLGRAIRTHDRSAEARPRPHHGGCQPGWPSFAA